MTSGSEVLFQVSRSETQRLTLVRDAEGLTICQNGEVIAGGIYRWSELDKAVEEFEAMAQRN